jgi:hypothetical protein
VSTAQREKKREVLFFEKRKQKTFARALQSTDVPGKF